jgi:multidrug efflux pump subunit AcrB
MKKLIAYFIKYPVAVNVMILAFIVFGVVGALKMRSSFFPLVDSKLIRISVVYPGASPFEMEEGVVLKIEDNLKGIVGVDRFTSTSSENSATISVETLPGYDIDLITQDVKNAVDKVPSFPTGMEPPVVQKVETIDRAVTFVVTGKDIPLKSLKSIAREVENDLRNTDGISQLVISGYPEEEIEIAVEESKLRAYNLTFADISNAVARTNILVTGGSVKTDAEEYLIRAKNRAYYATEIDKIIVFSDEFGNQVFLRDVATLTDKWSETPNRSMFNGAPSVEITVNSTNNEDLLDVADKTLAYVEKFNESHDKVSLEVTSDRSQTIRERTKLLAVNGGQGILLVVLFLSIFLKPRLALWVGFGLPVAFLGMFVFAGQFDVTINVLSLFGMIIVIGILVDDGIVIAENIYHHYEMGKKPIQAAIDGTMEVIPPIISAILTTVVAFSTFFFLEGRIGEFFGEVSTVVILTLGISLIEALIILPAHLAHSKALSRTQKTYAFNKKADSFMNWMRDKLYSPVLAFLLQNKFLGFVIPIVLFMVTIGAIGGGIIGVTFFPSIASDQVRISLSMPQGTNENITDSIISKIEDAVWMVNKEYSKKQEGNLDVVENVIKQIGPGTSTASLAVNLLPGEARSFPSQEISNAIEKQAGEIYGVERLEYGSGSSFGGKPVSVALTGENINDLKGAKDALKEELRSNPKLTNITDTDPAGIKEIKIQLKDNAYLLGLNLNEVMSQIRSGFFGRQVQRFQRGQDEIKVWVRYKRNERSSISNLDDMRIVTPTGNRVPFREIASYEIERGEVSISHLDGRREIRIEADLKDNKESATDVLTDIRENIMPDIKAQFPTVSDQYEGQNRQATKTTSSAGAIIPIILFLIYAIIAFTFRSYSQPLLLMLMIPFSMIGVGWGHWIHNFPINILSFLGIIALIGILVNDGLVLIGKFNGFLKDGMKFDEALLQAGKSRFRAIFLTSLTTVAGLAPLILFEKSRQAQFLIPMAISIAYGITVATFLTLLFLPLLLSFGNAIKVYATWLFTGKKPEKHEVERAIKEVEDIPDDLKM